MPGIRNQIGRALSWTPTTQKCGDAKAQTEEVSGSLRELSCKLSGGGRFEPYHYVYLDNRTLNMNAACHSLALYEIKTPPDACLPRWMHVDHPALMRTNTRA